MSSTLDGAIRLLERKSFSRKNTKAILMIVKCSENFPYIFSPWEQFQICRQVMNLSLISFSPMSDKSEAKPQI